MLVSDDKKQSMVEVEAGLPTAAKEYVEQVEARSNGETDEPFERLIPGT